MSLTDRLPSVPAPAVRPASDATPGGSADDQQRAGALGKMKLLATGLLVLAAVVFVVARQFPDNTLAGYVEAFAEAAMVGALADWFAVTALFRHPLGLPIPHTAIIAERKDDIGKGLGTFVQGNFLSGPVIAEKIRSVGVADRIGAYLADPTNARKLGENAGDAVQAAVEVLRDEDVAPVVEQMVTERVADVPAAALAAKVLDAAIADGQHQVLVESLIEATAKFLDRNTDTIRARVEKESPWWVPDAVDERIVARLTGGGRKFLDEVAADPDHDVRHQIDDRIRELAVKLRTSPEMEARGEELKAQLLAHPALRAWTSTLWTDLKATLITASADPDSELRAKLEAGIVRLGQSLETDAELRAKIDGWVERTVLYVLDQYRDEVADLISGTVARWDADDASRRIELQVGRDLQFIRINGTVVGGLVGLLIHLATQLL
ncbi:DUF445 domain-containing protein [Aquihabitans sp. G128]|uniref:DUF445 domain-containing protein n=1 Tax=Aquihabitans sp. G128 TaxID=2849779 RepID=UPI001C22971A|nr:DUF445 domain-containing protein [Aquihabitans sp. G128]QXC62323.1 DUF445 domain-containing protein [Aquihabitans sp. G128]